MKKTPFDFRRCFQLFEKLVSRLADTCIRNGENSNRAVSNLRRVLRNRFFKMCVCVCVFFE